MKKIFKNAKIITVNKDFELIDNGMVFVDDGVIVGVFSAENKSQEKTSLEEVFKQEKAEILDCKGNILMPGLINTHSHSAMSLFRGLADGANFDEWWKEKILPLEEKLTPQDIYNGSKLSATEMAENGITTFFDCYFEAEQTIKAASEVGLRVGVAFGAISGEDEVDQEILQKNYDKLRKYKNVYPFLYAHSVYSNDEFQFGELVAFANKHNLVISTHASETLSEVGLIHSRFDLTPIGLLESYGVLDVPTVLAHGVHLDKEDINILKRYENVTISHNPASNLKLGSGIAPISALVNNNINVSLGTDGPASNNSLDILKEMNLAINLQFGVQNNAKSLTVSDAIKMATVNGAKAFNINNLGVIEKGYLADFVLLNAFTPSMKPNNNFASSVVFSATNKNVLLTIVGGKIVYENPIFNKIKSEE